MPERGLSRIGKVGQLSVVGRVRGNRSQANSSSKQLHRAVTAVVGAALLCVGTSATRAATDYWDGDGVGTVGGGPGQWDLSLLRWGASPSATTYSNFNTDDTAVFTGPGSTVNLGTVVQGNLDIQSDGYFFEVAQGTPVGGFVWASALPTLNVAAGASAEMRFPITGGSAGLVKTGAGAFGFSGTLMSGTAPLTINGGTIYYSRTGATLGIRLVTIGAGSTLSLGKFSEPLLTGGGLTGSGTLVLGTLLNTAASTNPAVTNGIWGSTFTTASNGATTIFDGNIIDDGGSLTNAPFSGGHFVKLGTGSLTLTGNNSFRGPTLMSAGSLILQGGNALPDSPLLVVGQNTTVVFNSSETIGSLGSAGAAATVGSINTLGNTLTMGVDNLNNEFPGPVLGNGIITKVGSGKQFLTTAITTSTYTGRYVIQGGTFGFGADTRLGPIPAALTANYVTLDGGTLAPAMAAAAANITLNANRGITVTANGGGISYNNPSANNLSIQGPITGTGNIARSGSALINLQGNNSGYSGKWIVTDGITNIGNGGVVFGNNPNLGNIPAGTASWDISQARLQWATNNTATAIQTYTLASKPSGTFSYGPGVVVTMNRGGTTNFTVTVGDPASASSTLIRKTNGSLLFNIASGPLTLGAATSEQVLVSGGVPTVPINGGADTIVPGIVLTTSDASNEGFHATYDNFFGVQVASQSLKIDINACNNTDLFAADTTTTNTLTMSAVGVYALKVGTGGTGATIALAGGTLNIGGGASTDPAVAILNTASQVTATPSGTTSFGNHEAIIATFGTSTWNGVITGSQGFTKMGYGTLVLGATATLNYPGVTRIEQGSLNLGANNQLPANTDLVFSGAPSTTAASNPTLVLGGRVLNINSLNSPNAANGINANAGGPVINIGANGMIKINGSVSSSFNGQVTAGSGTSTIWQAGAGTLTLGITNAFASDRSATFVYNKLWVSGGGTVVLPISDFNVYPAAAGTPLADAFLLDNGTLSFPGFQGSGVGIDTSSLGGNFILNTSRGIRINSGGGTIDVQNPYQQISMAGNGALSGTATLTKTGAGILLLPSTANATSARLKLRALGGDVIFPADTSLGPVPTAFQSDNITLDSGGAIDTVQATNATIITLSANRGISIGAGGGELRQSTGIMNIAGPLTGSGPLRITTPDANAGSAKVFTGISDGTGPGAPVPYTGTVTLAMDSAVYVNAKNALGTGTITNDPSWPAIFGSSFAGAISLVNNFTINPGHTWDWATNNATNDLTLSGVISGSGDMYKGLNASSAAATISSPGTLSLANSANSFTGDLTVSQGTLVPIVNGALGSTSANVIVNGSGILGLKGNINYTDSKPLFISTAPGGTFAINNLSGNNSFAGQVSVVAPAGLSVTAGTLTLTNNMIGGGGSVLTKAGTGLLTVKNMRIGGLTISAGNIKVAQDSGPGGVSNIRVLTIGAATKLDLNDNKLITANPVGTWTGSTYTGVTGLVVTGRNGGTWNGTTGIITSQTSAIVTGHSSYTALGVATAAEATLITASDTAVWAGQTVSGTDTLVLYTYAGDATLDGRINIDDYTRIDAGIGAGSNGWSNGDFNYDGRLNIDDYTIIDANISSQGPQFFTSGGNSSGASLSGVSAVPEPTAAGLAFVATGLAQMARRRRRSKQTICGQNEPEKL